MIENPNKLIYLLGAGRSGTTLLAIMLNAHEKISCLGEMHQFLEHYNNNKACSCGATIPHCEFWSRIESEGIGSHEPAKNIEGQFRRLERHSRIPLLLLGKRRNREYLNFHENLFTRISQLENSNWLLDSSKYIARYLMLGKSDKISMKGIYLVRDVRGVIHSFGKNVQTRRGPINTILYYSAINFFGQLVCWTDKRIMKIRYEDLIEDPNRALTKIYAHIFEMNTHAGIILDYYDIPHIIGGNRLKHQKKIKIKKDESWKEHQTGLHKTIYYLLGLPFMILNKYTP